MLLALASFGLWRQAAAKQGLLLSIALEWLQWPATAAMLSALTAAERWWRPVSRAPAGLQWHVMKESWKCQPAMMMPQAVS